MSPTPCFKSSVGSPFCSHWLYWWWVRAGLWQGRLRRLAPKCVGAGVLLVSLGALLELFPFTPAIHGVLRGGGLVGYLTAAGLIHTFNRLGACIVAATLFVASLFLVTRFSFGWAAEFLQKYWSSVLTPLRARWASWQEARAAKAAVRQRRQMEEQRATGKRPMLLQKVAVRQAQPGTTHHHASR